MTRKARSGRGVGSGVVANILSPILILFVLAGCDQRAPVQAVLDFDDVIDVDTERADDIEQPSLPASKPVYRFGFDLRTSPQEQARQYLPFLRYLTRRTGYHFRLKFIPPSQRVADALGRTQVDFAALGAVSYLRAHENYGARILVRGVNRAGESSYRAALVAGPRSPLQRVADLKGRLLAFGSMSSTQGHLIPRLMLRAQGLTLADLKGHQYTGSHQACVEAVTSGRFDACGTQDTLARRLAAEGVVRVFQLSRPYPTSGIAVAPAVPEAVAEKVKAALLAFDPQGREAASLYRWERTEMPLGFAAGDNADYEELRRGMVQLGMLSATPEAGSP